MKYIILTLCVLLIPTTCFSKHLHLEREYQAVWCNTKGGQMEYVLPDKARVDCLLPDLAVEVDFAPKWAECVGQALYYGKMTNRTPACLLILEKPSDIKYLERLQKTVDNPFRIFTIDPTSF